MSSTEGSSAHQDEAEEVVVTFGAEAVWVLKMLQGRMVDVSSPQDVVVKAIEVLYAAVGKEIVLHGPGDSKKRVRVWR
jgi:CO dehydrogenase/acetyl-CoA synthase delta subunit